VAVVAPSGPVPEERLQAGLDVLRGWDLDPVVAPHVLDRHGEFGYLAGTDPDRAADFQNAWCDPAVDAVLCARGGYGAQRMTDLLDWEAMRAAGPKVFVGFSDLTVLHEAFATRLGLATLHGPMAAGIDFVKNERARDHLKATLFAPETVRTVASGAGRALVPGRARGITLGGCLSLLAAERGTPGARPSAHGGLLCLRTSARRRTGWTGTSPNSCAPTGSTGCAGYCSAPGRSATPTTGCGPCSPTGSARSGCPSSRSSGSGTARAR
jgi:muramoyltetrapeptide carboxypeptidase